MNDDRTTNDTPTNDTPTRKVSDATRQEERREAHMSADPGPMPSAEDEQAAERYQGLADADVAQHEQDMLEKGAHQKGEGRIA